jgi:Zn-finger nucleic acid-binding protein
VFHGHKHCPHCGVNTAAADVTGTSDRACPRCQVGLGVRAIGDVALSECPQCHGVFIDKAAIECILGDRQQARAESVVGLYRGTPRRADSGKPGGKLYIKCPQCGNVMNRKLFARGAGVIVDVCRGHGTWFDPGELPAVVEFVMNGGLEQAEKKEIAEQREAAQRAKAEARAMQQSASMMHHAPYTKHDTGAALIDLLFSIWR